MSVLVEIRSLNHRFLDVEIRAPRNLGAYDKEIKDLVTSRLARGRVSATITVRGAQLPVTGLAVDKALASSYIKVLNDLKNELALDGPVKLEQLLNFPDIITYESREEIDDGLWLTVKKGLELALEDLTDMRRREGVEIRKDLQSRVKTIDVLVKSIEKHSKSKSQELYEKLRERVREIVESEVLNEGRLETEVALLTEKMDVTEECIRFKSHNTLFLELLDKDSSEGRKLNFLLQEMHREANTIGAKASDACIAHWVVEIKEEVEKLREQVQNIE